MTIRESLHRLYMRGREVVLRRRLARELDEELRFHLDAEVAHHIARGMSPADAHRTAALAFGGVQRYREETTAARGFASFDGLARDARLALRRLRRVPTYTLGVVLTLAVGLGAAAGTGALVYGVMLRPLPYPEPDRLVQISIFTPGLRTSSTEQSTGTFAYLAERARSFAMLGASMENEGVAITDGDAPERVRGAVVTPNVLRMLGATPVVGRLLRDEDVRAGFDAPVMLSHELWVRRFGSDPAVAGRTIELQRRARLIVGVLPRGFGYPSPTAAIYFPNQWTATRAGLGDRHLRVVGRLAPGVSVAQAQAELDVLLARLGDRFPELTAEALAAAGVRGRVETLRAGMVAPVRSELTLLAIMVAALLLIAAANVATLALLRAHRLGGEVALSRALGASRGTIARRFVVEGVVLAVGGGLFALPLAALAVAAKFGFADRQIPRLSDVAITPGIALIMLGVSTLIGIGLGLLSAARAGGSAAGGPADALRGTTRITRSRGWRRAQESLVAAQIAVALALLLGAALLGSSFAKLRRVDIGFEPAGAAKFSVVLPFQAYPTLQRTAAFHLSLQRALRAIPGVTDAGLAMQFPSTPQLLASHPRLETTRRDGRTVQALVTANVVSADFFRAMGIRILSGRTFATGDLAAATPGVVLGASLARELFGSEDPLGREVRMPSSAHLPTYRVVGVSGDVYGDRLTDGALRVLYFPLLEDLPPTSTETEERMPFMPAGAHFVVRSTLPLSTLAPAFRAAIASIDPRVPLWDVRTLDAVVADATSRTRLVMLLLGIAAAATLLLGAIGLYSVIAYAVAGRSREFAVRLAIGATPRDVMRQVLREGIVIAAIGIVGGVCLSLANAGVLRGVLFEVSATDPATYVVAAALVAACTALATYAPARRAGNADPARALHAE